MSHIKSVELSGFTGGFLVIQPSFNAEEFAKLIEPKLPRDFANAYVEVYRDFRASRSGTIVCDAYPWVIVVFGTDPKLIRRRTLHEIVPLAKALYPDIGMRARFIERVYTETKIPS
jgi:hypothetical protein